MLDILDIINKKRFAKILTDEEIHFFIHGVTEKKIPDYQISALLMAITINGMTDKEMTALTLEMAASGELCDLSAIPGIKVDKHSTGGVGDKCTPVLLALLAACDVPVAKLSGRGLGFTGGTIDKLESIQGFQTNISVADFSFYIQKAGVVLSGQTPELAPADKVLYALRDVTATVQSIPLIASSIMSKKIAGGADAIVLDVTYGSGAFMKTIDEARALANAMINIGKIVEKPVICVLTPMKQPLGYAVGNVLEMEEAWQIIQGKGPQEVVEICITLAACMLFLSESSQNTFIFENYKKRLLDLLDNPRPADCFRSFISSQGGQLDRNGNPIYTDEPKKIDEIQADMNGYVKKIDAYLIGEASMLLGAGRRNQEDNIDPGAGIILSKKQGDYIKKGDVLLQLYCGSDKKQDQNRMQLVKEKCFHAIHISKKPVFLPKDEIEIIGDF